MEKGASARALFAGLAALALAAAMLAIWWPGVAMYDTIDQYHQAVTGAYEDWHPPVMARLWSLLLPFGGGQAPMFVLQTALYAAGLGLLAARLAQGGGWRRSAAVLAIGAWPLFSGWEGVVLKDAQMAAALVAATGLAGWWRLAGRRLPLAAAAAIILLLLYALLVRGNAVFAVVPLALALFGWPRLNHPLARAAAALAAVAALLALAPLVNHRLLGAAETGIERTLPTYDLAGIAHFAGAQAVPALPPEAWAGIEARDCYRPFFWDTFGDARRCGFIHDGLDEAAPAGALSRLWVGTIVRHPIAYAEHRLGHWNATLRWLVPRNWPVAAPPSESEPNDAGLVSPGGAAACAAALADWIGATPFGWPILWFAASLAVLALAGPSQGPAPALAFALALSAAVLEASFAAISISADLRYHLWPMLATALAWTLLAGTPLPRRGLWIAGLALALLLAGGVASRLLLAPAGGTYGAMLGTE